MKAVLLTDRQALSVCDVPEPAFDHQQIMLRTICGSICSTDVEYYHGNLTPPGLPIILGHEYVGEVVGVGNCVAGINVGDKVVYFGGTDFGGFAEYRAIRPMLPGSAASDPFMTSRYFMDDAAAAVCVLPDNMNYHTASIIVTLTAVLRSLLSHPPKVGDRVLILGCGPCGTLAGLILRRMFAVEAISVLEWNEIRSAKALALFADDCLRLNEDTNTGELKPFGYVFDTLPAINVADDENPRRLAKRACVYGAKYVLFGATDRMQKFDTWLILAKGIRLTAAPFDVRAFPMRHTSIVMKTALDYLSSGLIDANKIISHRENMWDIGSIGDTFINYYQSPHLKIALDCVEPGG